MNMFDLIEQIKMNSLLTNSTFQDREELIPVVLEAMGQEVRKALLNNEMVTIVGIGKLLPVRDNMNLGLNRVRFRPSRILRSVLNPPNSINIQESVAQNEK